MAYYIKKPDGTIELVPPSDLAEAREYEQHRFNRHRRTQRIDHWEKALLQDLFNRYGEGVRVLDVPCGTGRFFDIVKGASELTMIDVSEAMLAVAEERVDGHANARAIQANITELPLPDQSVDLSFCMRLFHHLPTDEIRSAALAELSRVTTRHIVLSFYNRASWKYWRRALLFKEFRGVYLSLQHLTKLAEAHGLKLLEKYPAVNIVQQQTIVVFAKT